jgi:hypothetical protein
MKRLLVACALGFSFALAAAGTGLGAIHPIMSGECAAAVASAVANEQNPPGQVPPNELAFFQGLVPVSGSHLRALIATGVILVDDDGFFAGLDFTRPALHGDSGVAHCLNA